MSTTRINFDYTQEAAEQLDELKAKLNVGSRAEVIRYAQAVLNWAVQQAENGSQVVAVNSDSGFVRELTVPPLEDIRRRTGRAPAGAFKAPKLEARGISAASLASGL